VTKSRTAVGRTTAFGLFDRPKRDLVRDLNKALQQCTLEKRKVSNTPYRKFPIKRLRSNLLHAMSCDVVFQPVAGLFDKEKKSRFCSNPVWDVAPNGAYYKAKRLCSLSHGIVMNGSNANIVQDLVRLSINIWTMPKRHFDGLCRRIKAKIACYIGSNTPVKSPEATERLSALTVNPDSVGERWFARNHDKRHLGVDAGLRLSKKLECAQEALWLSHKRALRNSLLRKGVTVL